MTTGYSDAALAALLDQVERSTASASAAIDATVDYVEASNQRIRAMQEAALREREAKLGARGDPRRPY